MSLARLAGECQALRVTNAEILLLHITGSRLQARPEAANINGAIIGLNKRRPLGGASLTIARQAGLLISLNYLFVCFFNRNSKTLTMSVTVESFFGFR